MLSYIQKGCREGGEGEHGDKDKATIIAAGMAGDDLAAVGPYRGRAAAAGIATKLGNHSFRATGITAYLKNGGTLEKAASMANHASTRTTQLYDRRRDEVSLDEVERIVI
jgi:integrase